MKKNINEGLEKLASDLYDLGEVESLKSHYQRGGLGDQAIKKRLDQVLQALIAPIRMRRAELARDKAFVIDVIKHGTERAKHVTDATKQEVVEGLGLFSLER